MKTTLKICVVILALGLAPSQIWFPKLFANPAPDTASRLESKPETAVAHATATPTATPSPKASPTSQITPANQTLSPDILSAVVIISGPKGEGTGFICNFHGKPYVATNQHVLESGSPLTIRTNTGIALNSKSIFAAKGEDIAFIQCDSIPAQIHPLEIAVLPDEAIHSGDPVIIPGNSKGDGVITQTPGKLLAIGPQRVEVDNPVYHGNSGSPIIHIATKKVIGILTYAKNVTLDQIEKASFHSQNSSIKSEIRYFGFRVDSVQKWEPLNWGFFQQTESMITQSHTELDEIISLLDSSSKDQSYRNFRELYSSLSDAYVVFKDRKQSVQNKKEAADRFLRELDSLSKRAKFRLNGRYTYFIQKGQMDEISKMSDWIAKSMEPMRQDNETLLQLFQHGN